MKISKDSSMSENDQRIVLRSWKVLYKFVQEMPLHILQGVIQNFTHFRTYGETFSLIDCTG